MARILDRYYPLCQLAGVILVFLLLNRQTFGQTSGQMPTGWGNESLYHAQKSVRGAASCSSSGCHGGPQPGVAVAEALRGSEYPIWMESDPHANSWKTMSSKRSVEILSKLGILRDGSIQNLSAYKNCLACHNTDRDLSADQITPKIAEGVGCEACHGPSKKWFDRHYQSQNAKTAAVENLGMTDSKPLLQRAKLCTMCHVGSKDRDMNHDIIAAGHPALYFDMSVYHEAYPKHWRESQPKSSDYRSELWLAGKIAMADAELELIEARSKKALPVSVWPELSTYQCNSCHASLNGIPKTATSSSSRPTLKGKAPVRNWNLAGADLLKEMGYNPGSDFAPALKSLRELLESSSPDAERVSILAGSLRTKLIQSVSLDGKPKLRSWCRENQVQLSTKLLETVKQNGTWESATAAYGAVWASQTTKRSDKLDSAMRTMREALLFPTNMQLPDFPKNSTSRRPPTLEEWANALDVASLVMKNDECK